MKIRDCFIQHPDGSWEPRQPLTIRGPNGQIQIAPGARFRRGVLFMGVDIAELCELNVDI